MAGSISDWAAIPSAIFKAKADTKDRAGGFSQKRGISLSPPTSSDFTFYLFVTLVKNGGRRPKQDIRIRILIYINHER